MPEFVIIGAQRSGTTSLYSWLCSHPDIAPAARKELHYFDDRYHRSDRWYRSHFPIRSPHKLAGEASPYLLFHPLAPERAARALPSDTRFIVLLRDPVERALSHYWFTRSKHKEPEPLKRAFDLEGVRLSGETERVQNGEISKAHRRYSYVSRGEYAVQLRQWFSAIPRERFLILESERLFAEPPSRLVTDWLGVRPNALPFPESNHAERVDEFESTDVADVKERLRDHFKTHNQDLFELLGWQMWQGGDEGAK